MRDADKVLEGLKGEGGTVLKTSLDHTKEAAFLRRLLEWPNRRGMRLNVRGWLRLCG
jgi:uncharacterized membrane protein